MRESDTHPFLARMLLGGWCRQVRYLRPPSQIEGFYALSYISVRSGFGRTFGCPDQLGQFGFGRF
jgi:hypothetical protein